MELQEMTLLGWSWMGSSYVVKLDAEFSQNNIRLRYYLYAADAEREIRKERFESDKNDYRALVHEMANDIYRALFGDEGVYRTKIAYIKQVGSGKEIFIADFDGYNERQLTNNGSINLSPTFSPDGEFIYFTSFMDDMPKMYMLTIKSNAVNLIAGQSGLNAAPTVSPDGKYLACVLAEDGNSEIYLTDRKGKMVKRLTYSWAIESSPTWSPDSREIAFTSDRTGSPQIYIMDAEGLNVRRLTYEGKYNDSPCWSPKGDRIAYVTRDKVFKICSVDIAGKDLRILSELGDNENPRFSLDGNHIAFSSDRLGPREIFTMDVFGHNQKRITLKGGCSNPAWSQARR
jgi:TolB protein